MRGRQPASHAQSAAREPPAAPPPFPLALRCPPPAQAANVNFGFWSHDIGGFYEPVEGELYTRWVQLGALSPIFRTHGFRRPDIEKRARRGRARATPDQQTRSCEPAPGPASLRHPALAPTLRAQPCS